MVSRLILLGLLALLDCATPAFAFDTTKLGQGGTLPLDDDAIQALIGKSSKLEREIDQAVAKAGKTPTDIICDGMRFPGAWSNSPAGGCHPITAKSATVG